MSTTTPASLVERLAAQPVGTYQTAAVRIGIGVTFLLGLLRDFLNRHQLWGPDAPWAWDLAERQTRQMGAFDLLRWSSTTWWFELVYGLGIAVAVAMVLGWHTRSTSVLFVLVVTSFQNHNDLVTNAGDNLLRLAAIALVLTRCGEVWSLDARRRRERGRGPDVVGVVVWALVGVVLAAATLMSEVAIGWAAALWAGWLLAAAPILARAHDEASRFLDGSTNLLHAAAIVVLVGQVCIVYATAGWYKIHSDDWRDGTAVYYATRAEWLNAWPALSDVLVASSVIVLVMTYGTVLLQVAFPFSLLNRRIKNVLLCFLILEHIGIGLLMGLPFFSMTMISVDLIFLPSAAAIWLQTRVLAAYVLVRPQVGGGREADDNDVTEVTVGPDAHRNAGSRFGNEGGST